MWSDPRLYNQGKSWSLGLESPPALVAKRGHGNTPRATVAKRGNDTTRHMEKAALTLLSGLAVTKKRLLSGLWRSRYQATSGLRRADWVAIVLSCAVGGSPTYTYDVMPPVPFRTHRPLDIVTFPVHKYLGRY
jgi:hypothetical protein